MNLGRGGTSSSGGSLPRVSGLTAGRPGPHIVTMSLANESFDAHVRRPRPAPSSRAKAGNTPAPRPFAAPRPGVGQLLALQGTAGNAAVQRLLADPAGPTGELML